MMQDEVVRKRKRMDEQHFLDFIVAANLIPGPNSTKMAIHIGHERAGWKGMMVAGLCFIRRNFPAFVSICGFTQSTCAENVQFKTRLCFPRCCKSSLYCHYRSDML